MKAITYPAMTGDGIHSHMSCGPEATGHANGLALIDLTNPDQFVLAKELLEEWKRGRP